MAVVTIANLIQQQGFFLMNLQRISELLYERGWTRLGDGNNLSVSVLGDRETYEDWEIALYHLPYKLDEIIEVELFYRETDTVWTTSCWCSKNQAFDFAEKTIRDVMRDYCQSPGQLSLDLDT